MNILLTGLPRSGSSMLCLWMSKHPDVIALNEGLKLQLLPDAQALTQFAHSEFDRIRDQIMTTGTAPARHKDGQQVDNHFSHGEDRKLLLTKSDIDVGKPATPAFGLAFKHNAGFTTTLPELIKQFSASSVFATIRNPLAVLGSWGSVKNIPVSQGRMRNMDKWAPDLDEVLKSTEDVLDKQLVILNYYFSQYASFLPQKQIIRYEWLCEKPVEVLSEAFPRWDWSHLGLQPTEIRNANPDYSRQHLQRVAERLLSMSPDAPWRKFYSTADIEHVMKSMHE